MTKTEVKNQRSDDAIVVIDPTDRTPPETVTGLSATALGAFQVTLNWSMPNDDRGVSGFRLMRDKTLLTEVDTRTSYTDAGLTPTTTYSYQIIALDNGGHESAPSDSVSVTTTAIAGGDLYALNCAGCHGDLKLSHKRDRSFAEIKGAISTVSAMAFLAGKLNDEQIYWIAYALSSLATDKTPPEAPGAIGGAAVGPTAIALSWAAGQDNPGGSGLAGYRVFRDGVNIVDVGSNELVYTDTELKPDTSYNYQVALLDLAGNLSGLSPVNTIKTRKPQIGDDKTPPSVPTNLTAQVLSATRISVAWSASVDEDGGSGLKGYRLFRNGQMIKDLGPEAISFADKNLTSEQTYEYTVSAVDNSGNWSVVSSAASATTPVADGLALYHGTCENCHTPVATSTKKDRTAAQIKQAIVDNAVMNQFDVLGDDELSAIAAVLATVPDNTAPGVPSGLTAAASSYSAVNLSWTASSDAGSGVKGYRLFRNGLFVKVILSPSLTTGDNGLMAMTTYVYKIAAIDFAGNVSGFSSTVSVTTPNAPATPDTTPPSVPTGFAGVAVDHRKLNLFWNASTDNAGGSGVKAYRIWRDGVALPDVDSPDLTTTDVGLQPLTTYHYTIKAIDVSLNQSAVSAEISVTTIAIDGAQLYATTCAGCHQPLAISTKLNKTAADIGNAIATKPEMASLMFLTNREKNALAAALIPPPDTTAPTVPTNLDATTASNTRINVSWTVSTDVGGTGVSSYRVYRDNVLVHTINHPAHSVGDTGLTADTPYSYRVSAVDAAGNASGKSTQANARTLDNPVVPDTSPPSVPTGVTAVVVAYNRIDVSWDASTDTGGSGVDSYKIMNGSTLLATVSSPSVSFSHTGLTAGTTVDYRIRAVDGAGNISALSPVVTATTSSINGATLYSNNCAGCHDPLAVSTKKDKTYNQITNAIATKPQMSHLSSLTVAEKTAIAAALASPPDMAIPSTPTSLAGAPQSATSISLTWGASTDNVGVVKYRLYRNNVVVKDVTAPGTATTDTGLTASTAYTYKVSALDAADNESQKSAALVISTPSDQLPPDNTKPSVPAGITVVVNSYRRITLSWDAATDNAGGSGVKEYKVFRNNLFFRTVSAPAVDMNDVTVAPDTTYNYRVAAVDVAGNQSTQSIGASGRTPVINGAAIYRSKTCETCHGVISSSAKMGASEVLITMALANIPAMESISLSTYEIEAIAKALRPVEPPDSEKTERFTYLPPVGTRHYITHKFQKIFLPSSATYDANDRAIELRIKNTLTSQVGALGGPCSRYDGDCLGEAAMAVTLFAPMLPVTNAARRGYMTRACDEVLSNNKAVTNALTRAGLTTASAATAGTIRAIYQLFYLNYTPVGAVSDAVLAVHQRAIFLGFSTLDAWRYSLTAVCDSVGVDSL